MRHSMTGFGKAQDILHGWDITVEMRSLNHRFLEISPHVPRGYSFLEEPLKAQIRSKVLRGKVEVSLTLTHKSAQETAVTANDALVAAYVGELRRVGNALGLSDDLTLSAVARLEGVVQLDPPIVEEDQLTQDVLQVAEQTILGLLSMRAFEGERLKTDLQEKLAQMDLLAAQISAQVPQAAHAYERRLTARMEELLQNSEIDTARIVTEVAIFAERVAIDEELVRLQSHLAQCSALLASEGAVGRKLDFLVQELGREVNCIGSKASDATVTKLVVEGKATLENMREQLQNLE